MSAKAYRLALRARALFNELAAASVHTSSSLHLVHLTRRALNRTVNATRPKRRSR